MERQYIILIFFTAIFIIAIIRQSLYWVWLWQLKEYRRDRLRAHFQDIGARSAFLALIGYSALRQKGAPQLTLKVFLISVLSFLSAIAILVLTVRIYLPKIFAAVSSFSWFSFPDLNLFKNLLNFPLAKELAADIAREIGDYGIIIEVMAAVFFIMPIIVFLIVAALNIFSAATKALTIYRAKRKIARFPNLKVVGITGSYGKSTAKEILTEILAKSKKYSASEESGFGGKILKTPANINTPIGIAQLILNKLDGSYGVFVVEMGAYKIGEIKEICDMVHPKIGIITAISEQHLALFGSIENTIKAKFELIDSLPAEGLAILNIGDKNIEIGLENENCISGDKCRIKARKKLYSVGAKADAYAINISSTHQNIKFTFISGADMKDFTFNIIGTHNISNALAAIIAARELGVSMDEIFQISFRISRMDFTLKVLAGPNGSTLIDDTYNANPNGVLAAIEYIAPERGRKFIIMSSLIELGSATHKIHENLGKNISTIAAKMFFLDNYYIADIRRGAAENKDSIVEIKLERDAKKVAEILKDELKPSDTVLFINRGARKVLEMLKK